MESESQITYSIDTTTPCKFLNNKENNLMEELNNNFLDTCFYSKFITKIKSIDRISMGRCQATNNSGKVTFNVIFTAVFTQFPVRTIIPKCKIYITNGQLLAITDNIYISLMKSNVNKILIDHQTVPIILDYPIKYNDSCKHVNAIGHLLLPTSLPFMNKIYKIDGFLTPKIHRHFINLIKKTQQITDNVFTQQELIKIINLLSPIKNKNISKDGINIINKISLSEKSNVNVTGYWYKYENIISFDYMRVSEIPKNNSYLLSCNIIQLSPLESFIEMLWSTINIRNAIVEITKYDKKEYEESNNVWTLMEKTTIA